MPSRFQAVYQIPTEEDLPTESVALASTRAASVPFTDTLAHSRPKLEQIASVGLPRGNALLIDKLIDYSRSPAWSPLLQ